MFQNVTVHGGSDELACGSFRNPVARCTGAVSYFYYFKCNTLFFQDFGGFFLKKISDLEGWYSFIAFLQRYLMKTREKL